MEKKPALHLDILYHNVRKDYCNICIMLNKTLPKYIKNIAQAYD